VLAGGVHPAVFEAFDRLCRRRAAPCGTVLEIGAVPAPDTLHCLPALRAADEKIGINLNGPHRFADCEIVRGDAHALPFAAARFDVVLCNAVLEHDAAFWRSLREMRRVARPGALIAIGVPAFAPTRRRGVRMLRRLARLPWLTGRVETVLASTPTLVLHDAPGDYYRFSPRAMRDVLLADLDAVEISQLMQPPRLIGSGLARG
jgi:SAM-dependent methyltransferase